MRTICVITGGKNEIAVSCAQLIGPQQKVILVDRKKASLENTAEALRRKGIEVELYTCDTTDRTSVEKLATYTASNGSVKTLIHAAGVSYDITDPEKIIQNNAISTILVNEAFGEIMGEGSCIVNIASMSGHMLSPYGIPENIYLAAMTDVDLFEKAMLRMAKDIPEERRAGMIYGISKNFVIWYTEKMALKLGKKGVRVLSVSPGVVTPMGDIKEQKYTTIANASALGRRGEPIEIAHLISFLVSNECSYLTGTDILCDGGSTAAFKHKIEDRIYQ